ncbi:MAG: metal-dependent hydrolase [Methanobacteriota archaeon]|nr:MAG: metal-dependent hydrolase [Euryarchaeota archaeon]
MMGVSHKIIGFSAGLATAKLMADSGHVVSGLTDPMFAVAGVAGMIGAIAPDIDHMKSKAGRALPMISFIVSRLCDHRGATHSIAMILMILYFLSMFTHGLWAFFGIMFTIGMLSHILADMLCGGVQLFWPITKKRIGLKLFRTGAIIETVIAATAFICATVYVAWPTINPILKEFL